MSPEDIHLTDEELLKAADGELAARDAAKARAHLAACWSCRARSAGLERTIADFVEFQKTANPLPPAGPGRALLRAQMAELANSTPQKHNFFPLNRVQALMVACTVIAVLIPLVVVRVHSSIKPRETSLAAWDSRAIPDPRLTPGATLPVTRDDVCTADSVDTVRIVPPAVAKAVFAEYGISRPTPKAYEVDYLITPALGGSDNVRNFWPQSYKETVWNAHIKDALEDHLYSLVCAGELDLTTAQQDIARDWVAAYKKYFHTANPLPQHLSFLKDRPWE